MKEYHYSATHDNNVKKSIVLFSGIYLVNRLNVNLSRELVSAY